MQELDLTILHHSGKWILSADALSMFLLPSSSDAHVTGKLVAAIIEGDADSTDDSLSTLYRGDEELAPIITYVDVCMHTCMYAEQCSTVAKTKIKYHCLQTARE